MQAQSLLKAKPPPRIRLEVTVGGNVIGFTLLDPLEFVKGIPDRWFRIQNGKGEIRLAVTMSDVFPRRPLHRTETELSHTIQSLAPTVSDSLESALSLSQTKPTVGAGARNESRRSNAVGELPSSPALLPTNKEKFEVHVSFEEYKGVQDLLLALFPAAAAGRRYWFSWVLFGQTFYSSEFEDTSTALKRTKDTIVIRCNPVDFMGMIASTLPFQCCLCSSEQAIIAVATINYDMHALSMQDLLIKPEGWVLSDWFEIIPVFGEGSFLANVRCSVRVGIQVCRTHNDTPISKPNQVASTSVQPTNQTSVCLGLTDPNVEETHLGQEVEEDPYNNDSFDDDAAPVKADSREPAEDEPTTAPRSESSSHDEAPRTHRSIATTMPGNEDEAAAYHDSISDEILRHFRLSLKIHSITNLRRPAPIQIHLSYPHFGTVLALRTTRSKLLQPFVENPITGGEICCNFVKTRRDFSQITAGHPLVISIKSATHMETVHLGDCTLDLSGVLHSSVTKYRDFSSGRVFETVAKYREYRQLLIARRNTGENVAVPPIDPVKIHSLDTFLSVSPHDKDLERGYSSTVEGAALRVSAVIEEIGAVGPEIAVNVKRGYQMQQGAFYDAVDSETLTVGNLSNDSGSANHVGRSNNVREHTHSVPFTSSLQAELAPEQRAMFDQLVEDWSRWQRETEATWREKLQGEEKAMRERLQRENMLQLSQLADDVRRGQEENAKLEIKLREKLNEVERKATDLALQQEKHKKDLANKAEDLQLLQRRVRDEAKIRVDAEARKCLGLESTITSLRAQLDAMERRARESEQSFENYRQTLRNSPEHLLREEVARLKAQLGECRAEIERQRAEMAKAQLEDEHQKALVHRLALELKREREKTAIIARQDHEQLRLEFLAREERYAPASHCFLLLIDACFHFFSIWLG